MSSAYNSRRHRVVSGVYYSLSRDLVHWSPRQLLMESQLRQTYRCGGSSPVSYPSAIDPHSPSRNFETTGPRFHLYFTRFNYRRCRQTNDRDLVRVAVAFSP